MTLVRFMPAAAILSLTLAVPAHAQNWPGQQNQAPSASPSASPSTSPSTSPWPNQAPAAAAPSPWPGQSSPASHPAWSQPARPAVRQAPQAQAGQPPCAAEFIPLRDDAQKKGQAIQAVVDKDKTDRAKICAAFKTFVAAEAKVVKFVKDNGARCGIPDDAVKVMKTNHAKSTTMRNRICSASAPAAAPAAPSLSDALGTSRLPDVSAGSENKGGTFNTLSGNALSR